MPKYSRHPSPRIAEEVERASSLVVGREPRSSNSRQFAIALFDELDPAGTTVHTLVDEKLWSWLHREEAFPPGSEAVEVPIPGTDLTAHVTIWDPVTDKAMHLVSLPNTGGRCHAALTALQLGPSNTEWFRTAYARLRREVGADHVFEGLW